MSLMFKKRAIGLILEDRSYNFRFTVFSQFRMTNIEPMCGAFFTLPSEPQALCHLDLPFRSRQSTEVLSVTCTLQLRQVLQEMDRALLIRQRCEMSYSRSNGKLENSL